MIRTTTAGRWFRRVMWAGIAANVALSAPTLFDPEWALAFGDLPPASPDVWPRFSGLLVILLSALYVPAALDPDRYYLTAWTSVGTRLAGVIFFFAQGAPYLQPGYVDLVFSALQGGFLMAAVRQAAVAPPVAQRGSLA